MSIEERLVEALRPTGLPIGKGVYTGEADTYLVYGYRTMGTCYADDRPWAETVLIDVHLYAPLKNADLTQLRQRIKALLAAGGYTWPSTTDVSDENAQHVCFECEEVVGLGEA